MGLTRQTKNDIDTSNSKVIEISRKICLYCSNCRKPECRKIDNI